MRRHRRIYFCNFACFLGGLRVPISLLPIAGPHLAPAVTAAFTPWPVGPSMGSCGTAAFTKTRVIISDISEDPRWPHDTRGLAIARNLVLNHGLRAAWSEPLISKSGGKFSAPSAFLIHDPGRRTFGILELIEAAGHIVRISKLNAIDPKKRSRRRLMRSRTRRPNFGR